MNVPRIKDPLQRRLHLLWIVPYLLVAPFIHALAHAVTGFAEVCGAMPESLRAVWRGRQ